ncbi:NADH-quinone oxidoreductase subunit G [Campylobacter sp. VicNov18]|uniref:NADH-quinone oxidoreductase subunit G n=1 Tax=Campylobacter bilis TaxID=2691918 RepID=UPI00130D8B23|nr:NADH-quinone oxidoreductase subunit G [Campylobacter bilis]MPV63814.1 NADH-quinone oxidoreductase subunit G [Campylobacter hepaticus]MBM0637315.1 NADH-quinone oxidoreductase subunit G [Campylobacter bilis]MCC8278034.1 NADH-quinone oxidoreductase subunit G [Campylobacter bilis]MCC8299538.1 NADH-quinone oxidoreductase subunit G [Campylobacter bilis]MCC8300943.1 NADH-quinone oxidoreductase subunit G [Campylobacter bilis]
MTIKINGVDCAFEEGEYILNIARRNDIFIPAICYLSGCTPTLACRMCMVEADGKKVYSCNTKAKEGMIVESDLQNLWDERNEIMQAYCINHPLECGVCDKSGECELQNFTHKSRVNVQKYWIKDTHKVHKHWGAINYDPSLCIVCERCITVCKDKIGESALKTVPRGGDSVDSSFKELMSKDAYAIWTKFQKSLIGPANGDVLDCSFCGECTSVCPTGALIGSKFQYSSNIWELKRIPASNPHSSDCELMYYDIKQSGIKDQKEKIYRVSNDFAFVSLNKAARFGFDTQNEAIKDDKAFKTLVELFENNEIKNIKFNSFITNEEALILQNLKKKFDLHLINEEALKFKEFLDEFIANSGEFYNANTQDILKSDFLVVAGMLLRYDAPTLSYKVNNALVMNKGSGLYFHPIEDVGVSKYSKNFISHIHKNGDEEQILYFLLQKFTQDESIKAYLDQFFLDELKEIEESIQEEVLEQVMQKDEQGNEILTEVKKIVPKSVKKTVNIKHSVFAKNLGIDEDKLENLLSKKSNFTLIVGSDFYFHKNAKKLAKLLALIQSTTPFKVFLNPTHTNTLGVAMICDLDNSLKQGKTLGYNERGDFSFSYEEYANLASASLNQQEGTFLNYDKRVVPTNAALEFKGYFLNDLANALGFNEEYTINYTKRLPINKGFSPLEFDNLDNFYTNGGECKRGYELNLTCFKQEAKKEFVAFNEENSILKDNEILLYSANPSYQFGRFSNRASAINETAFLGVSEDLAKKNNLQDKDLVKIYIKDKELALSVRVDKDIKNGAYLPYFDAKIDTLSMFDERFITARLEKIGANNE